MKLYAHASEYGSGELFFATKGAAIKSRNEEYEYKDADELPPVVCYTLPDTKKATIVALANGEGFAEKVEDVT